MLKKTLVTLCLLALMLVLPLCALADVAIDETNFPDPLFREYVQNTLNGGSATLTDATIDGVTEIKVQNKNTKNLKGIEYFTKLKTLEIDDTKLSELDVSKNTALTELICNNNQLTELDVSKNTALTNLICRSNQLSELDVSKNTALTRLICSANQLTGLDVSKNTALNFLECDVNQLTELDVSKNTALIHFRCDNNQLTELDLSKNPALETVYCSNNRLTKLDVSNNADLIALSCENNQLTRLDLSQADSLVFKTLGPQNASAYAKEAGSQYSIDIKALVGQAAFQLPVGSYDPVTGSWLVNSLNGMYFEYNTGKGWITVHLNLTVAPPDPVPNPVTPPKTGDSTPIMTLMALALLSLCGVVFSARRKAA